MPLVRLQAVSVTRECLKLTGYSLGLSGRFPDYNASKVTDSQYLTRQSAFQLMDKFFNSPRTNTAACLIHALAGSGKTQLAKGFAQKRSENGLKAYFLDASSSETLTQGFISFARSASLCPERDFASISSKELMPVVLRFLEALPHKWLLVYDNYDVFEGELGFDIGEFLPKSKWGSIIVTSRNAGVQRLLPEDCVRLELGNLSSQEGVELFAKRLRLSESRLSQQSRDLISTICTDLAVGMPLAISQSASFVLQSSRSLDDLEGSLQRYISDYASHQEELLSGKRDSYVREYGLSVMTTFNLSLRTVRAKNPHAANLLLLCGNFHHSGIQKKWFHNLCEARDRHETLGLDLSLPENEWFREMMSVEPGSGWDDFGLRTALGTLQDYDLIRLSDDSIEWNLHPLIHASCPAHAQEAFGEHYEAQVSLAAILIVANYDLKDDWADLLLIQCREHLTSHIEAWLKVATSSTSLLELAERPKNTPQVMNLLDALYDPKDTSRIVRDAVRARFRAVDVFYTSKRQIFAHIAIRKLVAWLVEYYEPKGGVVWHTLAMLRSQIEQEETRAPDDTQVKIAHARLYWSLVADCPDDEKLKVVEEGLQYLEANEAYLPAFDVLEIKETLYSNQFTNSKSDKDKRKAIKMLDAVSADLSGLVGPNHPAVLSRPIYTPIELRSRASRTDVMELSSRVRSTLKSRQGAGVQTYLLEQLLLFSDEDHGEDSPESVKLLNDLRNLEAVYDGKWSTPALTSTCDYYLRLDILKGGRHALTPISSFKSSWKQIPGVDFYLVCSIIAALGMHVYGPVFDIPLLWEGIRVESQQALSRLDRLRDSITAFKALEEFLLVKHADADASVVARLHRELEIATLPDTKQLIGRRIASLPKLAELWSSLTDLERTIISPDTRVQGVHEKKSGELERRIISHFHQSTSLTRLDLCVMAVFFFLHLIWKYPEYTILSSGFLDQFRLLVGAITSPQDSPRQHWLTVEIFVWQQLDNKEKSTRALCELEVNAVNERKADIDYKLNTGMTLDVNVGSASEGCLREAEVKNDLALGHVELSAVRLLDEIRREFSHRDWNTAVLASFQRHSTVWCERVDFVHAASEAALFSDLSNAARACDFTHDWQTLWTLFRLFEQHLVNLPTKSWWYCFAQLRWVLDDLLVDGMWRRAVICVAHWMSDVLEERSKSEDSLTDLDKFGARFQLQHRICEAYGELGYEWNVEQGTQELNALERQIRESLGEAVSIERRQGFEKMLESRTAYWEEKRRSNTTEDGPA